MKERDRVVRGPEVQSSGLLGDVSEQEANMTASAVPPAFALAAGAIRKCSRGEPLGSPANLDEGRRAANR